MIEVLNSFRTRPAIGFRADPEFRVPSAIGRSRPGGP